MSHATQIHYVSEELKKQKMKKAELSHLNKQNTDIFTSTKGESYSI